MTYLKILIFSITVTLFCHSKNSVIAQSAKQSISPPKLPAYIPPPPSFNSFSSKNGRYQLVSAEYYSQDAKPFLYKRLVKIDTTTGKTWILNSIGGPGKERREWVEMVEN